MQAAPAWASPIPMSNGRSVCVGRPKPIQSGPDGTTTTSLIRRPGNVPKFYIFMTTHGVFPRRLPKMKTAHYLTMVCFLGAAAPAISHPSSGIVIDERGDVLFVHSGRGLAKLDQTGKLTYVHQSTGGHWLCLDSNGSFSRTQPKPFERVTPEGVC